MKKKFLLTLLGILIGLPIMARDFDYTYEGQTITYTVLDEDAKTCKVTDVNGYKRVYLPEIAMDGGTPYTVVEIGNGAARGYYTMTSVTIPNSVTSIGEDAFYGCRGLTSVTIPNSVTSIGNGAFSDCPGLTKAEFSSIEHLCSIKFGGGGNPVFYSGDLWIDGKKVTEVVIPESITEIGNYTFSGCRGLTSVTIPNSVTSIGKGAFDWCTGLTSVTIPNSVTSIGGSAFYGCSGLTSVNIPNSVTSIGVGAFERCDGLTKAEFSSIEHLCSINFGDVTANPLCYAHNLWIDGKEVTEVVIPKSVTTIGNYTFKGCSRLTSVTIPNSVKLIGESAFESCSGLTSVTIPNSVTEIGEWVFSYCSGLTSVTIPNSVTEIGKGAFYGCSGLTSVTIPNSVTEIGVYAFEDCDGLIKAEFSSIEHLCSINFGGMYSNPLYYAKNLWIDGKEVTEVVIPESVTEIGADAFCNCYGLTKAEFSSIEHLCSIKFEDPNSNPLSYAQNLWIDGKEVTEVVIPESVTEIGNYTFSGCLGLTSVTIPNSVTAIGRDAFMYCRGLTSVTIPNSVTSIGNYAFCECSGLTSVTIGNSVTEIGERAFGDCSGLTSLTIGNSVKSIGEGAFQGCYRLVKAAYPSSLSFPSGLGVIAVAYNTNDHIIDGGYVISKESKELLFAPYVQDGKYAVPDGVSVIGEKAFAVSPNMTYIIIPDDVTEIKKNAFYKCPELSEVTLPLKLETLGEEVFSDCKNIKDVVYRGTSPVEGPANVFDTEAYENATLHVHSGREVLFMTVDPWKNFFNISDAAYSAVEEVIADEDGIDYTLPYSVYNLKGQMTGNSVEGLVPGMYIVRQGSKVKKMVVK